MTTRNQNLQWPLQNTHQNKMVEDKDINNKMMKFSMQKNKYDDKKAKFECIPIVTIDWLYSSNAAIAIEFYLLLLLKEIFNRALDNTHRAT